MFRYSKNLKKIKKSSAIKEAKKVDYDDNGRAQIFVGLRESDEFFSPYSYLTYELMNPEVAEYIEDCESGIPIDDELAIEIYTEEDTSNEEKHRIRTAVKRHHAEEIIAKRKELKRKTVMGLTWILIALAIFAVEFAFKLYEFVPLATFMDIAVWIFIWDGIELLLTERRELRRSLIKSFRLMNAKVHVRKYSKKIQREYGLGEFEEDEED